METSIVKRGLSITATAEALLLVPSPLKPLPRVAVLFAIAPSAIEPPRFAMLVSKQTERGDGCVSLKQGRAAWKLRSAVALLPIAFAACRLCLVLCDLGKRRQLLMNTILNSLSIVTLTALALPACGGSMDADPATDVSIGSVSQAQKSVPGAGPKKQQLLGLFDCSHAISIELVQCKDCMETTGHGRICSCYDCERSDDGDCSGWYECSDELRPTRQDVQGVGPGALQTAR